MVSKQLPCIYTSSRNRETISLLLCVHLMNLSPISTLLLAIFAVFISYQRIIMENSCLLLDKKLN